MVENSRATKKQRELLNYIAEFIKTTGYGPSYREVMRALDYKSVSTVAVHVNGLIAQGLLRKKDNSARSLEVVPENMVLGEKKEVSHIDWLKAEIKSRESQDLEVLRKEADVLRNALVILQGEADSARELSA
jgi:repressor LexA